MKRYAFALMTLLGLTTMLPLGARHGGRQAFAGITVDANGFTSRQPSAGFDAMVRRVMSFDANHDGRVTREELPERMQRTLFTRSDLSKGGGLTVVDVRRLAAFAPAPTQVRGLQVGHYGFGDDNDLDTRLHIEGAIEDLRLASTTRDEALGIGRTFIDTVKAQAKSELLAAARPLLTAEQFADFKVAVDQPAPRVVMPNLVTMPRAVAPSPDPQQAEAMRAMVERMTMAARRGNLARATAKYALAPGRQRAMLSAIQKFEAHDRLTADDRSALLAQLQGILSDQDRDDLRAALERRPIVKRGGAVTNVAVNRVVNPQQSITIVPSQFGVQNLVLNR
jgi:hypothetical protein